MSKQNSKDRKIAESGLHYSPIEYQNLALVIKSNWFLDVTKERRKNYTIPAKTRLFDDSKQILIFIQKNNEKYSLTKENELELIPNILSEKFSDLKKVIGMVVTFPGYLINENLRNILKSNQRVFKNSKFLKYYNSLNFEWSGQYAYIKFDNHEIRYCAHYGLQIIRNEKK